MYRLIYFITFLTGSAGLIYEITWQKYLVNLTGSGAKGTAIVLALFLLPLGLGYYYFGSLAKKYDPKKLIRLNVKVELGLFVLAILFSPAYNLIFDLFNKIRPNLLIEIITCGILIAPSSFLMGASIPTLTQFLSYFNSVTKSHAKLYIANTAGAFLGAIVSGFYLIPKFGLQFTLIIAALLNLIAAIYFIMLKVKDLQQSFSINENLEFESISNNKALLIASLSGLLALALQTILVRILALSFGASEVAFCMIVALYVLLLSLGTKIFLESFKLSLGKLSQILILGLLLLYFIVPHLAYIFHLIRINLPNTKFGFYQFHFFMFIFLLVILSPIIMPLGAYLPTVFACLKPDTNNSGKLVGMIYSGNALGCALGTLLVSYLLLNYFNLQTVFLIFILIALFFIYLTNRKYTYLYTPLVIIIILIFKWPNHIRVGLFHEKAKQVFSYSGTNNFYKNILENTKVIVYQDGPDLSAAVLEFNNSKVDPLGNNFNRSILVNGKSDGNTEGDFYTMSASALIPAAFLDSNTDNIALVVGLGTGLSSASLVALPWVKTVKTVEISKEVIKLATHFDFATNNLTQNPKSQIIADDAVHYLSRESLKYNLIMSLMTNFWVSGAERLFTDEFYKIVKARLESNGIFVQWMSLLELSSETAKIAAHTFNLNFPNSVYLSIGPSLLMLGKLTPWTKQDLDRFALNILKAARLYQQVGIRQTEDFLALNKFIPDLQTNMQTLNHPILGYLAAKDFYLNKNIEAEDIFDEQTWKATLKVVSNSLLSKWELSDLIWYDVSFVKKVCGNNKVNLVEPNWRYSRTLCREILVSMLAKNLIIIPDELKPSFNWLAKFQSDADVSLAKDANEAEAEINLYKTFYSPFLKLSFKKLKWKISNCYQDNRIENIDCRKKFIAVLEDTGQNEVAGYEKKLLLAVIDK